MYKIIGADGRQYGPVEATQIRRWLAENRLRADSMVQAEGATDWKPLGSFAEFSPDFATPPPLSSAPPPVAPLSSTVAARASVKIPAGICAILLGGLGVHKFVLGYTGAGITMLMITLLSIPGGFFTCGVTFIAPGIMHLIGIVEGIIYLTKSDEEFVRTYVDGRKEWF